MSGYYARRFWTSVVAVAFLAMAGSARAGSTVCGNGECEEGENGGDFCAADCGCAASTCDYEVPSPGGCYCDCECADVGDCCPDADEVCNISGCGSCEGNCGDSAAAGCACDCLCAEFGDCCADAEEFCSLSTTCVGACCFGDNIAGDNGTCEEVTESECSDRGGSYQGDFSSCAAGACDPRGACCISELNGEFGGVAGGKGGNGNCIEVPEILCVKEFGGDYQGDGTYCGDNLCMQERVDITEKGSLLIFSDVELEFIQGPIAGPTGWNISKDTVISLLNDYPAEVYVQMYFINGDPEKDAIFSSGPAPILISEAEPGCNWVDCQVLLTPDQPVYWSAGSGNPLGCQPFGILDPDMGNGPGRPNPDAAVGPRVVRGYIIAWAVDANGQNINWNHLSGKATIVDYATQAAWEYNAWAFRSHLGVHGQPLPAPGFLAMDGVMYDYAFDMLLFDFFAAGSSALSGAPSGNGVVSVDTDLTLHPVSVDVRQEHDEPVTTKAHFDIWNMNERKLSNTRRCITCWDQTLLSNYGGLGVPNNFLLVNLQSDKGKARIDGKQADECEENCFRDLEPDFAPQDNQTAGFLDDLLELEFICSDDAAILGVAAKTLRFGNNTIDYAGSELVGQGVESAYITYDVVGPPGTLREDTYNRIRPVQTKPARIDGSTRGK